MVATATGASPEVKRGDGYHPPPQAGWGPVRGLRVGFLTLGPIWTSSAPFVPPVLAPAGLASGQAKGPSQG